jgi:SAM-dependent methyltransferase
MHLGTDEGPLWNLRRRLESILEDPLDPSDDEMLSAFGLDTAFAAQHDDRAAIRARIERLPQVVDPVISVTTSSRLPGGSAAHKAIVAATQRQNQALLEQTRRLAQEVTDRLVEAFDYTGTKQGGGLAELSTQLEAVAHALASMAGEVSRFRGTLDAMEARLDDVEAARPERWFEPWFSSQDFDDEFRGTRDVLLLRYADLARLLATSGGPVVDLGCGRGELIELLVSMSTEAYGVEVVPELVDFCRSIYLDVRLLDARAALEATDDASLGGIAMIQVVEHLSPQELVDLVPLLRRKLRPGGLFVAETVNPGSPYVYTHSFYMDPTHSNPIPADYLRFLLVRAGFSDVRIDWRSPVTETEKIPLVESSDRPEALVAQVNAAFKRLNQVLFGPQDYALVATR